MHRRGFDGANLFTGKRGILVPGTPEPTRKEHPVTELLVEKPKKEEEERIEKREDKRYREVKPYEPLFHPQFNSLYSTLRSEADWRYTVDNYDTGTVTTVAGGTVFGTVVLTVTSDHKRLSEWPNSTQLFLVIRQFAFSPQAPASLTTVGNIDLIYLDDLGGQQIPLGDTTSNASLNQGMVTLIPTPITDPGVINTGRVQVRLSAGATVGTYNWQISFAYAYLLPSNEPHQLVSKKGGDLHVPGSTDHTRINTI